MEVGNICKSDIKDHMLRTSLKTYLKLLIHNDPAMLKFKPAFALNCSQSSGSLIWYVSTILRKTNISYPPDTLSG